MILKKLHYYQLLHYVEQISGYGFLGVNHTTTAFTTTYNTGVEEG
jgi:hypothetical protein